VLVTAKNVPSALPLDRRKEGWLSRYWQPGAMAAFILVGVPLFGGASYFPLLVLAGIYGIALVGVSLLAGLGGQLSLGHGALIGVGAYATALCSTRLGLSPVVGIAVGVAGALLIALITCPVLRLRGWYLGMATIALAFLFQRVAVNLKPITGGNDGIYGIPPFSIAGFSFAGEKQVFVLAWTLVLLFMILGRNIADSRFGRAMAAVHKDEDAALTLAVPTFRYKSIMWLISAVSAAIAGSIFAHYSAYISPVDFGLATSITLFVAVLLGGERSIFGGLVALLFLVCLPAFSTTGVLNTELIKGLALIVVYMISPTGLAGLTSAAIALWHRRRRLSNA
jgi:branched-chain amino acid transport system permease protein